MDRGSTSTGEVPPRTRTIAALWAAAGLVAALGTARLLLRVATAGSPVPGATRPDDLVLVGLAWLGVGLATWLAVGSGLALLALLPGAAGRLAAAVADRVTPLAVRKLLTLLLGASVGSLALPPAPVSSAGRSPLPARGSVAPGAANGAVPGLPGPGFLPSPVADADAAERTPGPAAAPPGPGFHPTAAAAAPTVPAEGVTNAVLSPGFRPSAPVRVTDAEQGRLLAPNPRPSTVSHALVTVRRGDSLWSIARAHLGPDASDAEVARAWPRWYAANRHIIGEDPDLLVPGQQLAPPSQGRPNRASSVTDTTRAATAAGAAGAAGANTHHPVPKE